MAAISAQLNPSMMPEPSREGNPGARLPETVVPGPVEPSPAAPVQDSPGQKLSKTLYKTIREFSDRMSNFSLFEMSMAGLGFAVTRGADWLAYFAESFGEWTENKLTSSQDKKIPVFIQQPLLALTKLWGVKDDSGKDFTWKSLLQESGREKAIGALNATLGLPTLAYSLVKPVLDLVRGNFGEKKESGPLGKAFNFVSKTILPTTNAGLMWASSAGKRQLANTISQLPKVDKVIDEDGEEQEMDVNGHWNSGQEDIYCGASSLGLMAGQVLNHFSPKLYKFYELALGTGLSWASFKNGRAGLRGEDEGEEAGTAKYKLANFEKGPLGKLFYAVAKRASSMMNLKLPSFETLEKVSQMPDTEKLNLAQQLSAA